MVKKLMALIVLSILTSVAFAKDFGVRGPVYDIAEENLLTLIHKRLLQMQQSGKLADIQQMIQDNAKESIQRPEPVKGITHATENRAWTYDPTWRLSHPIYDLNGQLVAKQGQTVNPLDWIQMPETLLFINADNKAEIEYTKQLLSVTTSSIKIILVNGNIVELVGHLNRPVYFDQQGLITSRFGILHTPAMVKQKGRVLEIVETAI